MFDKVRDRLDKATIDKLIKKTTKDKIRDNHRKEKLNEYDIKELMDNRKYRRRRGAMIQG